MENIKGYVIKKYTLILSKDSNNCSSIIKKRNSNRLSLPPPENPRLLLYPEECSLYKKVNKGELKNC